MNASSDRLVHTSSDVCTQHALPCVFSLCRWVSLQTEKEVDVPIEDAEEEAATDDKEEDKEEGEYLS